jgi:hypothetical protein
MDWNWFFSSLAQSVAALVGVVGAFLISSLLNNQATYARNRSRTRELLREGDRLSDAVASRDFQWYNKQTLRYALEEIEDAAREADEIGSPEDYYESYDLPVYLPKEQSLQAIERTLEEERERRRREAMERQVGSMGLGPASSGFRLPLPPATMAGVRLENQAHRQMYEQEAEAIRQLVVGIKSHLRAVEEHVQAIQQNPEASRVVRVVLLAILLLFGVGVIYPLSFLPVPPVGPGPLSLGAFFQILFSLRGLLLMLTSGVFTALVGYLWRLNQGLRHPVREVEDLRARLNPATYSEYLQVRIENGIPL